MPQIAIFLNIDHAYRKQDYYQIFHFILFLHILRFYLKSHLYCNLYCCCWSENDPTRDSKAMTRSEPGVLWSVASLFLKHQVRLSNSQTAECLNAMLSYK